MGLVDGGGSVAVLGGGVEVVGEAADKGISGEVFGLSEIVPDKGG